MNGDVPDNAAGGSAPGSGDEAAWLDLVARFDMPAAESEDGAAPWPEREDLTGPVHVTPAVPDSPSVPGSPTVPGAAPLDPPVPPAGGQPGSPGQPRNPAGTRYGPRDAPRPDNPDDEHYVPPPPPPLPKLDTVTKFAWLALFGGPCYLLVATIVGWTVSGLAAFLAVAAFVGGFAVLVIRMDNGGPRDSGPDDGAVV